MNNQLIKIISLLFCLYPTLVLGETVDKLTYPQVLQRVVDYYPSLRLAQIKVERASQEVYRVESSLGWNLTGQGGLNRDVSLFGSASDVADISANIERRLKSGDSIGFSGKYQYQDDEVTISPFLADPSHRTWLDLNYRMPFGRGKDNPDYQQGLISAEAVTLFEKANQLAVRDQLARQTLDLFYSAALVRARLTTAESAVERARRLKKYIRDRMGLGLSEEKDILQADAQLQSRLSDVKALEISWQQVKTTLNRLMGVSREREFIPYLEPKEVSRLRNSELDVMVSETQANSPDILRNKASIKNSEADIVRRVDSRKNQVDVVLSVGTRTNSGDTAVGSIDDNDVAGGIRLEYQQALDKRGLDAEIYQAKLDKRFFEEDNEKIKEDLRYSVLGLVAEIDANEISLTSHVKRLTSEDKKFTEALGRYRQGRTETDRLILFENELQVARFALQDQKISYEKRIYDLTILRGKIWNTVKLDYNKENP